VGWAMLHMEVTTPLFNGGADPTADEALSGADGTGVRVPSLRGAMHFWFRALAGLAVGPDLRLLATLERQVFGSTEASSPVKLRIPAPPSLSPPGTPDFVRGPLGRWVGYLLGQGLCPLRDNRPYVSRPYVAPGERFELQLRLTGNQEVAALAVASLWLVCAYGGLGARTRRGFGGLRVLDAAGPLPAPWDRASIRTPRLDHYEQLTRLWPGQPLGACMRQLKNLMEAHDGRFDPVNAWSGKPPAYPALSKTHTVAATSGGEPFKHWADVLAHAGEQLRWFRASRDYPEARYPSPKIKTPEWTEVVTGPGDHFGLGALGLPVVYKDHRTVNADQGRGANAEPLRRASPLWLRPVGESRRWRLLSYAFLGEFLPTVGPTPPAVHIWNGRRQDKQLEVTHDDVVQRATRWVTTMRQDGTFVRGER
jgi:CRISPR type III-B/RAMP module RAMP protein Cmr1